MRICVRSDVRVYSGGDVRIWRMFEMFSGVWGPGCVQDIPDVCSTPSLRQHVFMELLAW